METAFYKVPKARKVLKLVFRYLKWSNQRSRKNWASHKNHPVLPSNFTDEEAKSVNDLLLGCRAWIKAMTGIFVSWNPNLPSRAVPNREVRCCLNLNSRRSEICFRFVREVTDSRKSKFQWCNLRVSDLQQNSKKA